MTNSIVCEIPYAEMRADSYDPSGWMESMDIVCDGDREVCIVICTDKEPQKGKKIRILGDRETMPPSPGLARPDDWARLLKRLSP